MFRSNFLEATMKNDVPALVQELANLGRLPNKGIPFESGMPEVLEPLVLKLAAGLPEEVKAECKVDGELKVYLEQCIPQRSFDAWQCVTLYDAQGIANQVGSCECAPVGLSLGFFPLGDCNGRPFAFSKHDGKFYELGSINAKTAAEMKSNSTCLGDLRTFLARSIAGKEEAMRECEEDR